MPHDTWKLTEEDRARLQPLLDNMREAAHHISLRAREITDSRDGQIAIIQGGIEYLAEKLRERILQQVDRGEWIERDIYHRRDLEIRFTVDVQAALDDPDAELMWMSILPTWARVN